MSLPSGRSMDVMSLLGGTVGTLLSLWFLSLRFWKISSASPGMLSPFSLSQVIKDGGLRVGIGDCSLPLDKW